VPIEVAGILESATNDVKHLVPQGAGVGKL
jgi:hypothetical protein